MSLTSDIHIIQYQRYLAGQNHIKGLKVVIPDKQLELEKANDEEIKNRSSFEATFYALLQVLNKKYQDIVDDSSLDEQSKINALSEFLKGVHETDQQVEKLSELFSNENLKKRLQFIENGWEHRLSQQLLQLTPKISKKLDLLETGEVSIQAEDLYLQADLLESSYDYLKRSSLNKNLHEFDALIVRLRGTAAKENLGKGVPWNIAPELKSLSPKEQEAIRNRCLLDYATSIEKMEKVIARVAAEHSKSKEISSALFERLFNVVQAHAEVEAETRAAAPHRVRLVAEVFDAIKEQERNLSPPLLLALQSQFEVYWKNMTMEGWDSKKTEEETKELFHRLLDVLNMENLWRELAWDPNIPMQDTLELRQVIEEALRIFINKETDTLKGKLYAKELLQQIKIGEALGTDSIQIAGSIGLNPFHFENVKKSGNIREQLTTALNAIMPPSFYFAQLMGNESLVTKINKKLEKFGFSLDIGLAKKYKKENGRLFDPKPGITKASRTPFGAPLHKETRIPRKEASTVSGLIQKDIASLPLSDQEKKTIMSYQTEVYPPEKPLPWKTGKQTWMLQHAPLGKTRGFLEEAGRYFLPVVAGPSGTTDRIFELAQYLGLLNKKEDFQALRLACLAYLLIIDAHSYHEVMLGAMPYGLPYSPGPDSYLMLLPEDVEFAGKLKKALTETFPGTNLPAECLGDKNQIKIAKELFQLRNYK